jgi:hypothetical protein
MPAKRPASSNRAVKGGKRVALRSDKPVMLPTPLADAERVQQHAEQAQFEANWNANPWIQNRADYDRRWKLAQRAADEKCKPYENEFRRLSNVAMPVGSTQAKRRSAIARESWLLRNKTLEEHGFKLEPDPEAGDVDSSAGDDARAAAAGMTVAAMRIATGLKNAAIRKAAKRANLPTAKRGQRRFQWSDKEATLLLKFIKGTTSDVHVIGKCEIALRNRSEIAL